jgi:dTDP-4-dehydrorhamnose 3,5-epimerase
MHYQAAPSAEAKLVRCTNGAIYDVIVDLRPYSPTFTRWVVVEQTADNRPMLYIPEEFAHGFQTLEDNTEVFYHMSEFYIPEAARGVRWNDPAFSRRPLDAERIITQRDQSYPDFLAEKGVGSDPN